MNCLELILLLLIQVPHLSQDLRVRGYLSNEDIVPLQCLPSHPYQLIYVCYLVDNLITVWDDSMELLKCLQAFIIVSQSLIDQSQVINSLNTISFHPNSLQEELLSPIKVLIDKETVPLVDQCLGVVPVVVYGQVCKLLGALEVVLEEVQEGYVVTGHCHHDFVLLFKCFEALYGSLNLFPLNIMNSLLYLHLTLHLWQVSCLQSLYHIVVSHHYVLLYYGGHDLGCL